MATRRPRRARARVVACVLQACIVGAPFPAWAQANDDAQAKHETASFREVFARGVQLQRQQEWGRALIAFREALVGATGRNTAAIRFNIAVCERALGHFLAARRELLLLEKEADNLDPERVAEARASLSELEQLIARVEVTLDPPSASLSIDGGPLLPDVDGADRYLAGLSRDSAQVASLNRRTFVVLLDPGAHIFRANRPGHAEAVVMRSYREQESARLELLLGLLPATVAVSSEPTGAIVRVDGREVGVTPLELQRSAGSYKLEIERAHYNLHRQKLSLEPGERVDVNAPLSRYVQPLVRQWWLWTAVGAVVVGGVATAFAIRAQQQKPPYDGGSADWVARAP